MEQVYNFLPLAATWDAPGRPLPKRWTLETLITRQTALRHRQVGEYAKFGVLQLQVATCLPGGGGDEQTKSPEDTTMGLSPLRTPPARAELETTELTTMTVEDNQAQEGPPETTGTTQTVARQLNYSDNQSAQTQQTKPAPPTPANSGTTALGVPLPPPGLATPIRPKSERPNTPSSAEKRDNDTFAEMMEYIIQQQENYITPSLNLTAHTHHFYLKKQHTEWKHLFRTLSNVGFNTDTKNCWATLGINPYGQTCPLSQDVEQRVQLATMLFGLVDPQSWTQTDQDIAGHKLEAIREAGKQCEQDLQAVQQARENCKLDLLPYWWELDEAFRRVIRDVHRGAEDLSGLSDQYEWGLPTQIHSADQARETVEYLLEGAGNHKKKQDKLNGKELIIPTLKGPHLNAQLTSIQQILSTQKGAPTFHMLTPFKTPPSGNTPQEAADLWRHALLGPIYKKWIKRQIIFTQPTFLVQTGRKGPTKELVYVMSTTLSQKPGRCREEISAWTADLCNIQSSRHFIVDATEEAMTTISMLVNNTRFHIPLTWSLPLNSPASERDLPRLRLHGYYPIGDDNSDMVHPGCGEFLALMG